MPALQMDMRDLSLIETVKKYSSICAVTFAISWNGELYADPQNVSLQSHRAIDFIDATFSPANAKIIVAGRNGLLGWANVTGDRVVIQPIGGTPDTDFTTIDAEAKGVFIGANDGKLYTLKGDSLEEVASLSDFAEPVLDISISGSHWAVGGRGMVASSIDGIHWLDSAPQQVKQPEISLPANVTGELSFGIANIDFDSFHLNAKSDGKELLMGEDYELYAEEGLLQLDVPLDSSPAPSVTFNFYPGPAFRRGDVSWNVVLASGSDVLIAGEFGLILQSMDNGKSWVRRNGRATIGEQESRYWLAGAMKDERIVLTGAGGAILESNNGGLEWNPLESPTVEGIFGVHLHESNKLFILGAVGLIGVLENSKWYLVDRTDLQLQSWLRTPVEFPDGRIIFLGGRSTIVEYANGVWSRMTLSDWQ